MPKGGISFYRGQIRLRNLLPVLNYYLILSLNYPRCRVPFSSLTERIGDAHPTHGILLRRLEIQMFNRVLNPLSCDTLPFSLLLQLSVAYLLDPTISDAPPTHPNCTEMDDR